MIVNYTFNQYEVFIEWWKEDEVWLYMMDQTDETSSRYTDSLYDVITLMYHIALGYIPYTADVSETAKAIEHIGKMQ